MNNYQYLFRVRVPFKGITIDEGIVYKKGKYYYIEYIGMDKIRRLSEKAVKALSESPFRLAESEDK